MGIVSYKAKKTFGMNEVIKDFTFEAEKGKITVILGKNGCGKTTWINMALNLYAMDDGSITFDGKKYDEVRDETAVVFDEIPIVKNLSGYDNLLILSGGVSDAERQKEILKDLSLDDSIMRMKGKGFSFGQRHKLAVAAAVLRKPKYFFLDEPSVGLDLESWDKVSRGLRNMANNGCTIIITGHNYDLIEEIADNATIVKDGMVFFSGSMDELLKSDKNLKETYREIFMKGVTSDGRK